jgi:hypothetical protein
MQEEGNINETAAPPEEISRRIKHLDPDTVDNILTQAAQILDIANSIGSRSFSALRCSHG